LKDEEEPKSSRSSKIKEESPKNKAPTKVKEELREDISPPKAKIVKVKEEFTTPAKQINNIKTVQVKSTAKETNLNEISNPLNILPDKNSIKRSENEESQPNPSDFNLPAINVKSIKMNIIKNQNTSKKFNKQHFSPSRSPIKTKFTEIKIELNSEQKDWFEKQISKYDGQYDKEFDIESNLYENSNPRKRKY